MTVSSDILQDGYAGNLTTLRNLQLLCGFGALEAAHYCGVSPHTYRRWRADRQPSFAAVRLLAIRAGYPAELVAEICGVSVETAGRWKSGKATPSRPTLRLFCVPTSSCTSSRQSLCAIGRKQPSGCRKSSGQPAERCCGCRCRARGQRSAGVSQ